MDAQDCKQYGRTIRFPEGRAIKVSCDGASAVKRASIFIVTDNIFEERLRLFVRKE